MAGIKTDSPVIDKKFLVLIFVISLSLRILAIFLIKNYINPIDWENGIIARNIIAGKGFSIQHYGPLGYTSWQAPFYPYFLAFFYKLLGIKTHTFIIIEIIQACISSFIPIIIYLTTLNIFKRKAAFISAVILSVYPPLIWYCTRMHHTIFTAFLISLIVYLLTRFRLSPQNLRNYILSGIIIGIALLVEPIIFTAVPFSMLWIYFTGKKRSEYTKGIAMMLISIAAIILPWTIRNYIVHKNLVFVKDSLGKEIYIGNNPNATGTAYTKEGVHILKKYPPDFVEELSSLSEVARDKKWLKSATSFIRNNPKRFVLLTAKKTFYYWWYPSNDIVRRSYGGESVKYSGIKRIYWLLILCPALFGAVVSFKKIREIGLIYIWILAIPLPYIITHVGQQRFRTIIEPLIIIVAAYGIERIVSLIQNKPTYD